METTMAEKQKLKGDISGTRRCIEICATKFHIYFFLLMTLSGSCLFIVGLVQGGVSSIDHLTDSTVMLVVGFLAFALFFPWYLSLYFARHLLLSIKRLEEIVLEKQEVNE